MPTRLSALQAQEGVVKMWQAVVDDEQAACDVATGNKPHNLAATAERTAMQYCVAMLDRVTRSGKALTSKQQSAYDVEQDRLDGLATEARAKAVHSNLYSRAAASKAAVVTFNSTRGEDGGRAGSKKRKLWDTKQEGLQGEAAADSAKAKETSIKMSASAVVSHQNRAPGHRSMTDGPAIKQRAKHVHHFQNLGWATPGWEQDLLRLVVANKAANGRVTWGDVEDTLTFIDLVVGVKRSGGREPSKRATLMSKYQSLKKA
jgi:hypothetical protein